MKKPTKKEWLEHHTEMHILAKMITNTKLSDYVHDPMKPVSLEMGVAMSHATNTAIIMTDEIKPQQLSLNLTAPKVVWRVQIGRYSKGAYKTRNSFYGAAQALWYYHAVNIGKGYKKRLIKEEGGKTVTVAKQTS